MALSLNWLAFFILPAWLGYRKQWHALATLAVLLAAIPFFEGYFGFGVPNSGMAGLFLAMAFLANGLLLAGANSIFIKLKKNGMNMEQIRNSLKNRASSSVASAIIGALSFLVFQIIASIVAAIVFGEPA